MNDNTNKDPKVSDEQMDQLLAAFYPSEVPSKLEELPSSWAAISGEGASPVMIAASDVAEEANRHSSASRGIAVAVSTLTACLIVMLAISSNSGGDGHDATADGKPGTTIGTDNTMNVSEQGGTTGGGAVGEDDVTLDEIENIELHPEKKSPKESSADKK